MQLVLVSQAPDCDKYTISAGAYMVRISHIKAENLVYSAGYACHGQLHRSTKITTNLETATAWAQRWLKRMI